ncbi:glycosyltransferase [Georgenia faecalis]|uniref:glycosyltransferase n=1 Tax=Georgenia faecalis TaxID=2483799 RepID=UPI001F49C49D|nr:glycosyltransferase [Georgenia faecalis]
MAQPARRLSVVLATRIFLPEPAAASLRLAALVRALSAQGHEVRVLTTTAPGDEAYVAPPGVRVSRWPVLRDKAGYVRGYVHYLTFDVPLVLRLLTGRRPDVVVVEPPPTTGVAVALTCALRRVPYVYYAPDVWSDAVRDAGVPAVVQRILRVVERTVMRRARAVLATSPGVGDRLTALGVPQHVMVGNGVDVATFTPHGPVADEGDPYLVYAGTASEWQGADLFTRAMALVLERRPRARLVFIGQGSDIARMREQAAAYPPGAVTFHDRVPPEVAAQWIRGARAALASVRPGAYEFALPTKVYAAAACGTPVVFAGAGPARDVIASGDLGAVVDYDVEAVADALVAALDHAPTEAERTRRAAWAAEHVSIDAAARRVVEVLTAD